MNPVLEFLRVLVLNRQSPAVSTLEKRPEVPFRDRFLDLLSVQRHDQQVLGRVAKHFLIDRYGRTIPQNEEA